MIQYGGYRVLADMTKFIFFLHMNFKTEMTAFGIWPQVPDEQIVYVLDWYCSKLRPFAWEFYGICTMCQQKGLTNDAASQPESNPALDKLREYHNKYVEKLIYLCEEIENKFFANSEHGYFYGNKPTVVDHVFYQEFLNAMIISG